MTDLDLYNEMQAIHTYILVRFASKMTKSPVRSMHRAHLARLDGPMAYIHEPSSIHFHLWLKQIMFLAFLSITKALVYLHSDAQIGVLVPIQINVINDKDIILVGIGRSNCLIMLKG